MIPSRVFDLTAELRRYFDSGLLAKESDLYLLLVEVEALKQTVTPFSSTVTVTVEPTLYVHLADGSMIPVKPSTWKLNP